MSQSTISDLTADIAAHIRRKSHASDIGSRSPNFHRRCLLGYGQLCLPSTTDATDSDRLEFRILDCYFEP